MIGPALAALGKWRGYALVSAVALALGFGGGWKVRGWIAHENELKRSRARVEASERAREVERRAAQTAAVVGGRVEARSAAARVVTRTIIEKVPIYVSSDADAHCIVPVGFVRVHDAAIAGLSPAAGGADGPDEAASGIELSDVARTVAGNYGACHEAVEMVTGWQDFYRRLQEGRAGVR